MEIHGDDLKPARRTRSESAIAHIRHTSVAVVCLTVALMGCGSSGSGPTGTPAVTTTEEAQPAPARHEQWSDAIVYFVIIDRFADGDATNNLEVDPSLPGHFHGGDFRGLTEHLDEIADLGVTALWVTPIVTNITHAVTGAGFPDYGYHGYWADDFTTVDPRLGTEDEFKDFVAACHQRGIAVLLDVVYNHAGYESRFVEDEKYWPWIRVYGDCGEDDLTQCVGGLPDFRTELPEVRRYLLDAQLDMAERLGVDGFRLDTVKHVSHDFWQQHREETRQRLGDDFFLLGEVWGGDPDVLDPYFAGDEMDAGFDFSFQGNALAWVQGRGRTIAFNRYLERRHRTRDGYHLAHYLSSHDVPTAPHLLDGDAEAFLLATTLQLTTVGIPVLYYGEEVGRRGGDWPDNRSHMPWGTRDIQPGAGVERDDELRAAVTRLISIRRDYPALSRGRYETVSNDGDILAFARIVDDQDISPVLVILNRGSEETSVNLPLPGAFSTPGLYDVLNENQIQIRNDGNAEMVIPARSARILVAR
jgi:glycosidase